ncbi:15533_t:CDS:10 [Entrophospora sp. SA101]|nr:15533_t:CDS:10 [Entrophospora sp. SA101]
MSRSLKKPLNVNEKLLKKAKTANQEGKTKAFKTWARGSVISPEMIGHTLLIHNGKIFFKRQVTQDMSIIIKSSAISISPQKLNLVAEIIRKKELDYSLKILEFLPKKGGRILHKLLAGAAKNLEKSQEETANFYLSKIEVNRGRIQKRVIYRAKGRTNRIRKRYSLVNLHLRELNQMENYQEKGIFCDNCLNKTEKRCRRCDKLFVNRELTAKEFKEHEEWKKLLKEEYGKEPENFNLSLGFCHGGAPCHIKVNKGCHAKNLKNENPPPKKGVGGGYAYPGEKYCEDCKEERGEGQKNKEKVKNKERQLQKLIKEDKNLSEIEGLKIEIQNLRSQQKNSSATENSVESKVVNYSIIGFSLLILIGFAIVVQEQISWLRKDKSIRDYLHSLFPDTDRLKIEYTKNNIFIYLYIPEITFERENKGIKIEISGRLDESDIAQTKKFVEGKMKLSSIDSNIKEGRKEVTTSYGHVKGNGEINYGDYGLQAQEGAYISNRVIEAGRKVIMAVVKTGTIIFEIQGLPKDASYEILKKASYKFPIKCKVVEK